MQKKYFSIKQLENNGIKEYFNFLDKHNIHMNFYTPTNDKGEKAKGGYKCIIHEGETKSIAQWNAERIGN